MRSDGIISLTLKSRPTSGNATPLAPLTWRRPAQIPTRVTPDGRRLPRRKHADASGLVGSIALKATGTEGVDGELSLVNSTRDTTMKFTTIALAAMFALTGSFALAQSGTGSASGSSAAGAPAVSGTTTGSSTNGTTTGSTAGSTTAGPATGPTYTQSPSGNTLGPNASPSGSTLTPAGPGSGMGR
jgi:hypothetical protein